jgi:hypothetical protein
VKVRKTLALVSLTLPPSLTSCGSDRDAAHPIVRHETALEAIRRVAQVWESTQRAKGMRSPPSRIAMFDRVTHTRLPFVANRNWSIELLEIAETFELRSGIRYACQASGEAEVSFRFGRRHGDPAVEMRRPAIRLTRDCKPPDFPELTLELPATTARFRLTGDRLKPFEPPLEKRVYVPTP